MKHSIFGLLIAFSFLIAVSAAGAQSFGKAFEGMGDNDQPIQIEADRLEITDNQNIALLTGNVNVTQGNTLLKASRIKVFYLSEGQRSRSSSGIKQIEAAGKVAIRSQGNRATADTAIVDMVKQFITLSGNVVVSQGNNILKGCRMTVNLKNNVANVKPCQTSNSQGQKSNGRVKILLTPQNRKNN